MEKKKIQKICWYQFHILSRGTNIFKIKRNDFITDSLTKSLNKCDNNPVLTPTDDEPDDGPEHYVFVSGFHQPLLIPLLAELGVNVDAIIKVISDDYEVLQPPPATATETEPPSEEKLQGEY